MSDNDGNRSTRSQFGWVALMVVGEIVMAVSAASLDSVRTWAQFTIGALLVAAGGLQLRTSVLRGLRAWLRDHPPAWWPRATAWAALLIVAPLLDAIENARLRPVTPHYSAFSAKLRELVRAMLLDGATALPPDHEDQLQRSLAGR